MGESANLEKEIDNELNFPMSSFVPAIGNVLLRKMLRNSLEIQDLDLHEPLKPFLQKYPNYFLPHAVAGLLYHSDDNPVKARQLFDYAHHVANTYKQENEPFLSLLPSEEQFFGSVWKAELKEIVSNTIWTINGPFFTSKNDNNPIDLQCSIVKLIESDDIIIINPLQFSLQLNSNDIIEKINSIGIVVAIITTTNQHGKGIEDSSNIWPDAKLFGTHKESKHDHPNLPWCGFLKNEEQLFEPDLVHYQLKGQNWRETVFYHPSSGTLLGLADLGMSSSYNYHSWSLIVFNIGLGLWRGSKHSNAITLQNYQSVMITDWEIFRESWIEILELDILRVVLGHGGIIEGSCEDVNEKLHNSLSWLLDPKQGLSMFEKVYLPPSWIFRAGIHTLALKLLWRKLTKS